MSSMSQTGSDNDIPSASVIAAQHKQMLEIDQAAYCAVQFATSVSKDVSDVRMCCTILAAMLQLNAQDTVFMQARRHPAFNIMFHHARNDTPGVAASEIP